jgi:exodeoxyribonuclease VII large subunit
LIAELSENSNRLNSSIKNIVSMSRERVVSVQKLLPSYQNLFNLKLNDINILAQRLPTAIKIYLQNEITNLQTSSSKLNLKILKEKIKNSQNSLSSLKNQLTNNSKTNLSTQSNRVLSASKLLESLSYKSVIKRGFSVVRNSSNIILTKKTDVLNDKKLNVETKFGTINVTVDNE